MNPKPPSILKRLTGTLLIVLLCATAAAEPFPVRKWVDRLSKGSGTDHVAVRELVHSFNSMDSAEVEKTLDILEEEGSTAGPAFQLRILHARIWFLQDYNQPYGMEKLLPLLEEMMQKAEATGKKELIAYASWIYGSMMYSYNEMEPAVTYSLKAVELYETMPVFDSLHFYYSYFGEMLFHTNEYTKSIHYTQKAIALNTDTARSNRVLKTKYLNTLGQCYLQLGQPDSAFFFYQESSRLANAVGHTIWKGINASDFGYWYFVRKQYSPATAHLRYAYETCKEQEKGIAAYSLLWLARINIMQGKTDSASLFLDTALQLLDSYGKFNPLQVAVKRREVYSAKAELYRVLKQPDSLSFYQQRYQSLRDSLERVAILSSSKVALLRIENEKNQYLLRATKEEKRREAQKRNSIIIGISLLAIIIILVLARQKAGLKHQQEMARLEKSKLHAEVMASREKLDLFTQTLVEKSSLLEQLQEEVREKKLTSSQQDLLLELSNLTILTEDDWNRFRNMFEKVYPGFFMKLKNNSPDITVAEQRMAALTRLSLSTKQMAAMLGISVDAVHKTRQRLRNRLHIDSDVNLEEYIQAVSS
ncbi:tetratricopeptide repeat protein [Flavihumibacter sp. ZG627]|uniref:tetratricopeptide repeat protein n=1 Tax=Flavihumibacter sp. ZG627 TaxID=1463156 RepID=UPI0005824218|nr:tetratricopeptide repeat protein [Flavihumibacter sp. ZG627]KIC92094.1 hypothetical protein HY58_00560 [Flavihumibacter sp. ZG627]